MVCINAGIGYLLGAGSQNSTEVEKELIKNKEVNKTFGVLYTAINKNISEEMSNRGLAGVFNLHCRQFIDAVADALPSTIAKLTTKNLGMMTVSTIGTNVISNIINYLV